MNFIKLNGVNSNTINGLLIQELPPITKPKIRTIIEEIDGRDGDITTPLGYSAYDKEFTIGLYKDFDINAIISYFNSKGEVVFSNEPDKYYRYEIIEQIDFERLVRFRTAVVKMHVQPFKYKDGEQQIEVDATETTAEGTNFIINNTENGAGFNEIKLKGQTSQYTTNGYQLFDINNTPSANKQYVINNGFKLTKGTNRTIQISLPNSIPAGTYYISADVINSTLSDNNKINVSFKNANNADVVGNVTFLTNGVVTTTAEVKDLYFFIVSNEADGATITLDNIMLNSGSTRKDFEKYTGEKASPNPDFPQEVKVVKGSNNIKIMNKNIFDFQNATNQTGITERTSDGTGFILRKGTNRTNNWRCSFPAGTYTIQFDLVLENQTMSTQNLGVVPKDANQGNITAGQLVTAGTGKRYTFIATKEVKFLYFFINNSESSNCVATITNLMVLEGTYTSATSYVEYQEQNYPLDLPVENLFDGQLEVGNISWGANISDNNICRSTNYIEVKGMTNYIFSIDGIAHRIIVSMYDKDKTFIADSGETGVASTTGIFKTYTSAKYIRFRCYNGDKSLFENGNLQLELGTKANAYTPYGTTPIELCKIGTAQDYIYKNNGNWFIHKEIEKITWNGTETWRANITWDNQVSNETMHFYSVINNWLIGQINYKSDKFIGTIQTTRNLNNEEMTCNTSTNVPYIFVKASRIGATSQSTEEERISLFKTWLTNNHVNVYYALATPTETQITDENLITQLEELWNATTYEEQTNIITSGDLEPIIYVKTYTMPNASFTITNSGNIYSKPKIVLWGIGTDSLYLNGSQVLSIDFGETLSEITIDSENMEATSNGLLANRKVTGNYSNLKLNPGNNTLSFTGSVEEFHVYNYNRWI